MFAFGSKYLSMKSSGAILIEQCESVLFHGTVKDAPAYHERSNHAQYDPIMCACVCVQAFLLDVLQDNNFLDFVNAQDCLRKRRRRCLVGMS